MRVLRAGGSAGVIRYASGTDAVGVVATATVANQR